MSHYHRARNAGEFVPRRISPRKAPPSQQLESIGWDISDTDCWEWRGARLNGYGRIGSSSHGEVLAHRAAYIAHHGPIPTGMAIHHTCANRACVNPDHLQQISDRENKAEMMQRGYYLQRISELEAEVAELKATLTQS